MVEVGYNVLVKDKLLNKLYVDSKPIVNLKRLADTNMRDRQLDRHFF